MPRWLRKSALVLLAAALAGCQPRPVRPSPIAGWRRSTCRSSPAPDYAFDAAAPDGSLPPSEAARLDGWFRSLHLGYGDSIYVDGAYADAARDDVARVAGHYGLLLSNGAPVTAGRGPAGHRSAWSSAATRAEVPNCPNWSDAVAAQLRQPQHVQLRLRGELATSRRWSPIPRTWSTAAKASGVVDAATATQGGRSRTATPRRPGKKGLKDISTKKGN